MSIQLENHSDYPECIFFIKCR